MNNYGHGPSTGLDQTAAGKIATGFTTQDLGMTDADRDVLRSLAERVAQIAASPKMQEARLLWQKTNRLEKTRPAVFCDPENGWNEIVTEAQMKCRGKLARRWEMDLRKEIFWGEEMGDDKPVEPHFDVPYTISPDDWGLKADYHQTDRNGCLAIAGDVLGDILNVRLKGIWWWSLGLTWPAATFRGLNNVLYDLYDHPDELKELLSLISQGHMDKLDYLEANNLLSLNSDGTYVGSGGWGFTDDLPRDGFDEQVCCADMWGFVESQETVNVSPEMYAEFIFPYEKPITDRFGQNCYGCCEPLHSRWHQVKQHHNLRRVSCSPWADVPQMAEYLQDNYVFSMKPNPAAIASPEMDEKSIRNELREAFQATKGCVVEVIMKDNHTIGNRPENVVTWCRIAKQEAEAIAR